MSLYSKELRKNFSVPLYYQLKQLLLKEIHSGAYGENVPLPPEMELAKKFQISRPTVRQAICSLVNEGILTRTKGKGTYVIQPDSKQEFLHRMNNYNQEVLIEGELPETKLLSLEKIPIAPEIANHLEITEDSQVFKLVRLRYADHEPAVLITTYIPTGICAELSTIDFTRTSLYQAFAASNLFIKKVKRLFEVKMPDPGDVQLLEIPENVPLFHFTTTAYTTGQIPIEYSFTKYRGDRNKFFIELSQ